MRRFKMIVIEADEEKSGALDSGDFPAVIKAKVLCWSTTIGKVEK